MDYIPNIYVDAIFNIINWQSIFLFILQCSNHSNLMNYDNKFHGVHNYIVLIVYFINIASTSRQYI